MKHIAIYGVREEALAVFCWRRYHLISIRASIRSIIMVVIGKKAILRESSSINRSALKG